MGWFQRCKSSIGLLLNRRLIPCDDFRANILYAESMPVLRVVRSRASEPAGGCLLNRLQIEAGYF